MRDPATHFLIHCPACDFVWSAVTLPIEMMVAANLMKRARCPKCDRDAKHLRTMPADLGRAARWARDNE